jgi:hypothetical protein
MGCSCLPHLYSLFPTRQLSSCLAGVLQARLTMLPKIRQRILSAVGAWKNSSVLSRARSLALFWFLTYLCRHPKISQAKAKHDSMSKGSQLRRTNILCNVVHIPELLGRRMSSSSRYEGWSDAMAGFNLNLKSWQPTVCS